MAQMEARRIRSSVPRPALGLLALVLLLVASCTKSKVKDELKGALGGMSDYWGQPAGPEEQLTPGFPETAARLHSALDEERQKLMVSDVGFDQFQEAVSQLREETRRGIRSRVDRDLDLLLEGYAGKLDMLRNYRRLRSGAEYLPTLRQQLDDCKADLDKLFAVHPMPRPSVIGAPLNACIAPVPRKK
jgi:hypothetical protein